MSGVSDDLYALVHSSSSLYGASLSQANNLLPPRHKLAVRKELCNLSNKLRTCLSPWSWGGYWLFQDGENCTNC